MSFGRFDITSFVGPLPLEFGMPIDAAKGVIGIRPTWEGQDEGEYEVVYGEEACIRLFFGPKEQGLLEVSFRPCDGLMVVFNGGDLFADPKSFEDAIHRSQEPLECMGFIVLRDLGIAFSGFHDDNESQKAVGAFSRGRWDELLAKAKPFSLKRKSSLH